MPRTYEPLPTNEEGTAPLPQQKVPKKLSLHKVVLVVLVVFLGILYAAVSRHWHTTTSKSSTGKATKGTNIVQASNGTTMPEQGKYSVG